MEYPLCAKQNAQRSEDITSSDGPGSSTKVLVYSPWAWTFNPEKSYSPRALYFLPSEMQGYI